MEATVDLTPIRTNTVNMIRADDVSPLRVTVSVFLNK